MNHLHPLKILGKNFQAIKNIPEHKGIEKIIKDLVEAEKTDYCIHIQNNVEDKKVEQITIMFPDLAP